MKKSLPFIISAILHFVIAAAVYYIELKPEKKEPTVTVELKEKKRSQGNANKGKKLSGSITPISKSDKGIKPKGYYWGIGVVIDWLSDDGFKIAEVHEGYSAESAGLMAGDIILLIDGSKPYDNSNDIRGEEPKDMVLTINRNGKIFEVKISRCKVYY